MIAPLMDMNDALAAARRVMVRAGQLAAIRESAGQQTRAYLSVQHLRASHQVAGWMEHIGMTTWQDAVGNICGRYEGKREGAKAVLLGAHLDTMPNAGRYDGTPGLLCALEVVACLSQHDLQLEQAIEIVGFGDDMGARFGITSPGSRGLTGSWPAHWLNGEDASGVSVAQAMILAGLDPSRIASAGRPKSDFSACLALYIGQGQTLEKEVLAAWRGDRLSAETGDPVPATDCEATLLNTLARAVGEVQVRAFSLPGEASDNAVAERWPGAMLFVPRGKENDHHPAVVERDIALAVQAFTRGVIRLAD